MLEVEGLTKVFGRFKERVVAIDNLSFKVGKGSLFGFLGPTGAGKTTTIKILAGILLPTSGSARIAGYDIITQSVKAKQELGMVPEILGFYEEMRALDNLCFYAEFYIPAEAARVKRAKELLSMLGLGGFETRKLKSFSYGMRKRFALACALINEPSLLILDEPMLGLDPEGVYSFRELIRKLNSEGVTIFISSHVLSEVQQLCSEVCILDKGKIITLDTVENLTKKLAAEAPVTIKLELKEITNKTLEELRKLPGVIDLERTATGITVRSKTNNSAEINKFLVVSGVSIMSITAKEPTLEEIFLKLTGGKK